MEGATMIDDEIANRGAARECSRGGDRPSSGGRRRRCPPHLAQYGMEAGRQLLALPERGRRCEWPLEVLGRLVLPRHGPVRVDVGASSAPGRGNGDVDPTAVPVDRSDETRRQQDVSTGEPVLRVDVEVPDAPVLIVQVRIVHMADVAIRVSPRSLRYRHKERRSGSPRE